MESFKASTQYGDWQGTASADDVPTLSLDEYLEKNGLIKPHEFLIAASFYTSEHDFASISVFLFEGKDFESVKAALDAVDGPVPVRRVDVKLTAKEFLDLFKRFHVMLTLHGLELDERAYDAADELGE